MADPILGTTLPCHWLPPRNVSQCTAEISNVSAEILLLDQGPPRISTRRLLGH